MVTDRGALRLTLPADPRARLDVGPPFRRLNSGWLALDFVNTVPGWLSNEERRGGKDWGDRIAGERLLTYDDIIAWSRLAGVVSERAARMLRRAAAAQPQAAGQIVRRAHTLRATLFRLFRAVSQGWTPLSADVDTFNRELRRLRENEVLVPTGTGYQLQWLAREDLLAAPLWPPLRSALSLLTQPDLAARLGQCGGEGCGWLFVDVGRGRVRQWCDIRDCGNLAKVRAFRSRVQHER
jgi:predicted RNA-binding Zn ribbon-like protein